MTLAQSLGVEAAQHVAARRYTVYILRSFCCQTCKAVQWSVLHQVGHDSDFVFDHKIVCSSEGHLIQDRVIGEDANVVVTCEELMTDQAVAYLKKRLHGQGE